MLRVEIDDKYKWNLADIVKNETEWNAIYNEIKDKIKQIANFAGKLDNKKNILDCLNFSSEISEKLESHIVKHIESCVEII